MSRISASVLRPCRAQLERPMDFLPQLADGDNSHRLHLDRESGGEC
jgi:hypothetical protein